MQAPQNTPGNRHISSSVRPRVLFIVDAPNWAHDSKTGNLIRTLGNDYGIRKLYQAEVSAADLDQADLILVYYWFQFESMQRLATAFGRNRHKLLLGVCSHSEIEGSRGEAGLTILRQWARPVFAVNRQIYRKCHALLNVPVVYAPNGVDTKFYRPASDRQPGAVMRVGWAGSLLNHGPDQRGYYDLIVPAASSVPGVELVTAAREDKWRGPEEMREFYHSLDVYICASRSEGAPNPCLEAAACGVPLLTTRVGNMPELVLHGLNGFFVDRDIEDLRHKMCLLRDNVTLRHSLAQRIHQDIQAWDWSIRSQAYRRMFEETLNEKTSSIDRVSIRTTARSAARVTEKSLTKEIGAEQVKEALTDRARRNVLLIPDSFFRKHRELEVTIVMLSYGRIDRTLNAVRALRDNVVIPFKLLLIDNNSDDETRSKLSQICSECEFIELILLNENLGCARGRTHSLNYVNTEYVMFVDNDIEVCPGTVEHLLYGLESNSDVLAVAGNVILPDGAVHLCGGDYWSEDMVLSYELLGNGKRFDDPLVGRSGICKWVNGGLTMFRKSILVNYPYDLSMRGYYEDLEWCYRLNEMGIGRFYKSVEAVSLHYHNPVLLDDFTSVDEGRRHSMKYVEAIAYFYKLHGRIIQNLFDFVAELGSPTNQLSVTSARIFLELVNSHGSEWVLEQWNRDRLAPLFQAQPLTARLAEKEKTIQRLLTEVAEKERSVITLSAQLAVEQQSVQTLSAQLADERQSVLTVSAQLADEQQYVQTLSVQLADNQESIQSLSGNLAAKDIELKRISNTLGWRILSLYGRIKYPYLLPLYRLLHLVPREPKTSDKSSAHDKR